MSADGSRPVQKQIHVQTSSETSGWCAGQETRLATMYYKTFQRQLQFYQSNRSLERLIIWLVKVVITNPSFVIMEVLNGDIIYLIWRLWWVYEISIPGQKSSEIYHDFWLLLRPSSCLFRHLVSNQQIQQSYGPPIWLPVCALCQLNAFKVLLWTSDINSAF